MQTKGLGWLLLAVGLGLFARGGETNGLQRMSFSVDGVVRSALVYVPTNAASNT